VVYLPTDYSPTVLVPNHTGILDGSLTGSVLAEAPWIDSAAIAFLAHEAGCVVTTFTGEALPPLHTCTGYQRAGVVMGTSPGEWSPLRQAASARAGSGTGVAGAAAPSCPKLAHC
jgi:myo-inositol-1(or 4)-monophosphatase